MFRVNGTSSHQTPTKKVGSGREIFFRSADFSGVVEGTEQRTVKELTTVGVWVDQPSNGETVSAEADSRRDGTSVLLQRGLGTRIPLKRCLIALLPFVPRHAVVLFRDASWSMYRV